MAKRIGAGVAGASGADGRGGQAGLRLAVVGICAVSGKLGIGSAETLRTWVCRAEVEGGYRRVLTNEQVAEVTR